MDSDALKLLQARRTIEAERALRSRAEHDLRLAQLEVTRLRRAVVALQRQAAIRAKGETANVAGA